MAFTFPTFGAVTNDHLNFVQVQGVLRRKVEATEGAQVPGGRLDLVEVRGVAVPVHQRAERVSLRTKRTPKTIDILKK